MARKPAGFDGFRPQALDFFRDLAANNERGWFTENKPVYEREVLAPFRLLLQAVTAQLAAREIPLSADPARAIFRIHRDVRFSHDKTPYKTHAGAVLSRDGGKAASGILYVHVAAEGCFTAAGFWQPEREQLGAIREAIYTEPDRFAGVQSALAEAGLALDDSDSLTLMPRGFEDAAEAPTAAAIRLKSFIVRRPIDAGRLADPALAADIVDFAASALPLLRFGWSAISVLDPTALTRQK